MDNIPKDVPGLWEGFARDFSSRGIDDPRIVIHGGYGKQNTGDDAILHVLLTRARSHFPKARITVVCHGPENISRRYPDLRTCHFSSLATLRAILRSHIYIIGGGGIVNRINTYSGFQTFRLFDMKGKFQFLAALGAKITGAKSVFYAIGATSIPDPLVAQLARLALSRADVVSVRDPLTMRNLREIGVKRDIVQVLDPALSLEPAAPEKAHAILERAGFQPKGKRERPLVGLNLRYVGDPEIDNEKTLSEATELVRRLIDEHKVHVFFLSISQHPSKHLEDDKDFGNQIAERLDRPGDYGVLDEYPPPTEMMALLGEFDFLILSRLHATILAWKMGTPFYTVSYDFKVTEFVKLAGQEDRLLLLGSFSADAAIERLIALGLLRDRTETRHA